MDLIITLFAVITVGAGLVTFFVTRRDFGTGRAVAVAVGTGLVVGVCFMFVVYLAVVAFAFAVIAYLVARRWLPSPKLAAWTAAVVYTGAALASAAAFAVALENM